MTTAALTKKLIGLLGDKLAQMPQRAAEMKQGLLEAPSQLAGLLSPEMAQRTQQAMAQPAQVNPKQWIDKGMELSGVAPVMGLAGTFIGKTAKTWDAARAQLAEELLGKGLDPREVWKQTGTFRGVDNALMQEIPDNAARYDAGALAELKANPRFNYKADTQPLGGVVGHKALYDAYPELADMPVHFMPKDRMGGAYGAYSQKHDRILFDDAVGDKTRPAVHEIQHAIQKREGWEGGGNPEMMRELLGGGEMAALYSPQELNNAYRSLAGESLARLTQARMNMTMPERLQSYPPDMFDVPANQQILSKRKTR